MPEVLLTMPPGTPVQVRLDNGSVVEAKTTGKPFQLPGGAWVVKTTATGAGGFNLARCTIIKPRGVVTS